MPEIYGDHLTVAGDPDQQVQHIVHRIDWASLSDEEIEAIEMFARATERTFAERRRTGRDAPIAVIRPSLAHRRRRDP